VGVLCFRLFVGEGGGLELRVVVGGGVVVWLGGVGEAGFLSGAGGGGGVFLRPLGSKNTHIKFACPERMTE